MIIQCYPITLWATRFAWLPCRAMRPSRRMAWTWLRWVESRSIHEVSIPNNCTVPAHRFYNQHRLPLRHDGR